MIRLLTLPDKNRNSRVSIHLFAEMLSGQNYVLCIMYSAVNPESDLVDRVSEKERKLRGEIYKRLSRSRQLGGLVPVFGLGVPPR